MTVQSSKQQSPYGSWESPITTDMLVSGAARIGEAIPDGHSVYWSESRPEDGGRVAILRYSQQHDQIEEMTGPDINVRTLMHEYGGGSFWAADGMLWYVNYVDQRLYELDPSGELRVLSPEPMLPKGLRYADFRPTADGQWLISVCEQHRPEQHEPENFLVAIARDGSMRQIRIAEGADFYGSVCLSPDGRKLAWIEWNHPHMPWESTRLMCAEMSRDKHTLTLPEAVCIAGGPDESVIQPLFSPDNRLHYLSDRDDTWQVYREGQNRPVLTVNGEVGYPPWVHGMARYAFDSRGALFAAVFKDGVDHLALCPEGTEFTSLRSSGDKFAFVYANWQHEDAIWFDGQTVRAPRELNLHPELTPEPESLVFSTGSEGVSEQAYALFYRPANPEFTGPEQEKPPLIVMAHGGPTSAAHSKLVLSQRFWTSRGFAVVDVNYRGSSGYGRRYRQKLEGQWGVADVEDCVAVARYLVKRGDVDPRRLIIRGGSAGGFTVLSALAHHDIFTAGCSMYGVADLKALAEDTHKFESRYLDSLIGRWPEDRKVYEERSPINHLDGFTAPMIVLQGSEDSIVPPNQSRMIVDALDKRKLPVAYIEFEGEQHGFRKADTIIAATTAELTFYGRVFGFTPAGTFKPLGIRNLA